MSHLRTQIRDAIATAVTGLATTGSRVHKSYANPFGDSDLPALLVKLEGREDHQGFDISTAIERDLTAVITGYAKSSGDVDAILNQIALEVETALAAAPTLAGKCSAAWVTGLEAGIDTSLEKPAGRIDITLRVKYFTTAGSPGTLI